jgi:hypothetical protein
LDILDAQGNEAGSLRSHNVFANRKTRELECAGCAGAALEVGVGSDLHRCNGGALNDRGTRILHTSVDRSGYDSLAEAAVGSETKGDSER